MLTLDDSKTKAIVLFRSFSLLAAEAFERYLADDANRQGKSNDLRLDTTLTITMLHTIGRNLDFCFPHAGQLDRLATALLPELRVHTPKPEDSRVRTVATDTDAAIGCFWLRQAIRTFDLVVQVCAEEPQDGQVALAGFLCTLLESSIGCMIIGWRREPADLTDLIVAHCGFPRGWDDEPDDDDEDDEPDEPTDAPSAPDELVTTAAGSEPRTWRFREWL